MISEQAVRELKGGLDEMLNTLACSKGVVAELPFEGKLACIDANIFGVMVSRLCDFWLENENTRDFDAWNHLWTGTAMNEIDQLASTAMAICNGRQDLPSHDEVGERYRSLLQKVMDVVEHPDLKGKLPIYNGRGEIILRRW